MINGAFDMFGNKLNIGDIVLDGMMPYVIEAETPKKLRLRLIKYDKVNDEIVWNDRTTFPEALGLATTSYPNKLAKMIGIEDKLMALGI